MKVSNLIKRLKSFDKDQDVVIMVIADSEFAGDVDYLFAEKRLKIREDEDNILIYGDLTKLLQG